MAKRSVMTVLAVFFCIAFMTMGCKKGCPTCRTYGYNSTLQAYSTQVCMSNSCTCPNGFEGDSCQTYSLNKYLLSPNTWLASDVCSGNTSYYVYMSTNPPYYTYFYINNLFNSSVPTTVNIVSGPNNTGNNLIIYQQTVGGATFYGSGTYYTNAGVGKIILNLDYNNGIDQNCTVILNQQ